MVITTIIHNLIIITIMIIIIRTGPLWVKLVLQAGCVLLCCVAEDSFINSPSSRTLTAAARSASSRRNQPNRATAPPVALSLNVRVWMSQLPRNKSVPTGWSLSDVRTLSPPSVYCPLQWFSPLWFSPVSVIRHVRTLWPDHLWTERPQRSSEGEMTHPAVMSFSLRWNIAK